MRKLFVLLLVILLAFIVFELAYIAVFNDYSEITKAIFAEANKIFSSLPVLESSETFNWNWFILLHVNLFICALLTLYFMYRRRVNSFFTSMGRKKQVAPAVFEQPQTTDYYEHSFDYEYEESSKEITETHVEKIEVEPVSIDPIPEDDKKDDFEHIDTTTYMYGEEDYDKSEGDDISSYQFGELETEKPELFDTVETVTEPMPHLVADPEVVLHKVHIYEEIYHKAEETVKVDDMELQEEHYVDDIEYDYVEQIDKPKIYKKQINKRVQDLLEGEEISKRGIRDGINSIFDIVEEELITNSEIRLDNFGKFTKTFREARSGRNPFTGEIILIEAGHVVHFKASKRLKDICNENFEYIAVRSHTDIDEVYGGDYLPIEELELEVEESDTPIEDLIEIDKTPISTEINPSYEAEPAEKELVLEIEKKQLEDIDVRLDNYTDEYTIERLIQEVTMRTGFDYGDVGRGVRALLKIIEMELLMRRELEIEDHGLFTLIGQSIKKQPDQKFVSLFSEETEVVEEKTPKRKPKQISYYDYDDEDFSETYRRLEEEMHFQTKRQEQITHQKQKFFGLKELEDSVVHKTRFERITVRKGVFTILKSLEIELDVNEEVNIVSADKLRKYKIRKHHTFRR